ncbi:MAG: alkaline phosphatase D family protein [Synoicihabitans sp.]
MPPLLTRFARLISIIFVVTSSASAGVHLGQGTMSGEVTATSALVQTRLTATKMLDEAGDIPGAAGVVAFEWSDKETLQSARRTGLIPASDHHDFIARAELTGLQPNTRYFYRAVYGPHADALQEGPICSFKTHPGEHNDADVSFIVGSCMNYNKFMHGKAGNAGPVITATAEDKRLGFPAFVAMRELKPDFFIGTGDIVYYDNPYRRAETVAELRQCWHEQFRFPRMVDFFRDVPTYWSKDDHDFRYNDSDNSTDRLPLPPTGIELFREQLPIVPMHDPITPTYRTYRVSKDLQIWITEGRDYRSPNNMEDGPGKTLWGIEQRAWLQRTLKASDAKWKLLITPTPMVGPDIADSPDAEKPAKTDNHASLNGFRHEADAFFDWLQVNRIENFMTICGDRHWQYHSIHPSGHEEFAVGALNDENSRLGVEPGDPESTDPDALVTQPYITPEPRGGFLRVTAGDNLLVDFYDAKGNRVHQVKR